MSRGGDASEMLETLIKFGADVNAKDNYELTPVDRLAANSDDVHLTVRAPGGKTKKLVTLVIPAREWTHALRTAAR